MHESKKDIKKEMLQVFNISHYDWMNYIIFDDDITFHHIIKEEDGGLYCFDNGALLTKRAHTYLHYIEKIDYEIYFKINEVLKEINESRCEPSYNTRLRVELLLFLFEIRNCDRIIKRKEKIIASKRGREATLRRIRSQLGEY